MQIYDINQFNANKIDYIHQKALYYLMFYIN